MSLPALDSVLTGTEDGLSGSIIAVGRRLREEVLCMHSAYFQLLYLMLLQMSVIGHDQKQLQVRAHAIQLPHYSDRSVLCRTTYCSKSIESQRACLSRCCLVPSNRRETTANAPFRKQYYEICRMSFGGFSSCMESRMCPKSNICTPKPSSLQARS